MTEMLLIFCRQLFKHFHLHCIVRKSVSGSRVASMKRQLHCFFFTAVIHGLHALNNTSYLCVSFFMSMFLTRLLGQCSNVTGLYWIKRFLVLLVGLLAYIHISSINIKYYKPNLCIKWY